MVFHKGPGSPLCYPILTYYSKECDAIVTPQQTIVTEATLIKQFKEM